MTIIPAIIAFVGFKNSWNRIHSTYYSSPYVITAATFLFLFFAKHEFNNRVINWIACSTFSLYLIHQHPIIVPYFKNMMVFLSESYSTFGYSIIVVILAIAFLFASVLFDKIRIISWKFLCSICIDKLIFRFEQSFEKSIRSLNTKAI